MLVFKNRVRRNLEKEKYPEYKVLALTSGERQQNISNLFKGVCNNCGKYGHSAENLWVNRNNNKGKHRFNREYHNCGTNGHREAACWKKKDKKDDADNLFVGNIFCGKVSESRNEDNFEQWLGDSGTSSYITYRKNSLTNVEYCKIDVTVGNGQNMQRELKGAVNMKLQGREMVKLSDVLCISQAVKNLLSILRLVAKGATMGDIKYKMTIKKNGVIMTLNAGSGENRVRRPT